MDLHFRHMLVVEVQSIGAKAQIRFRCKALDQGLAAARIAGHRVHHKGPVGRQQPAGDQRRHQRQKAGRIAAGIGNEARRRDSIALSFAKFRKAIGPALRDPMRSRGVDDPRAIIVDQRHRLDRRLVGQAEDYKITVVDRFAPRRRLLALRFGQLNDGEFAASGKPLGNLQASRANSTINENRLRHSLAQVSRLRASTGWSLSAA